MTTTTLVGYIAGTLSSIGFVPQVIKGFKTKQVKDVAIWQPVLLSTGMMVWLIYGIMLGEMPMILANSFAVVCNVTIIIQKFIYK
ncbi:MAG: hypothetical protein LLG37_09950 [Spirochaetia bacterium]|nr:hypothetical protein [Spirochaetia bacterium]